MRKYLAFHDTGCFLWFSLEAGFLYGFEGGRRRHDDTYHNHKNAKLRADIRCPSADGFFAGEDRNVGGQVGTVPRCDPALELGAAHRGVLAAWSKNKSFELIREDQRETRDTLTPAKLPAFFILPSRVFHGMNRSPRHLMRGARVSSEFPRRAISVFMSVLNASLFFPCCRHPTHPPSAPSTSRCVPRLPPSAPSTRSSRSRVVLQRAAARDKSRIPRKRATTC